jgi:hypothetical protein
MARPDRVRPRPARLVDRAAGGLLSSVAIRKPRLVRGAVVYALAAPSP